MMGVSVRPMEPADARQLGAMHHQAWIDTYGAVLGEEYFTRRWTLLDSVSRWQAVLTSAADPDMVRLVALGAGAVVGFVTAGPGRTVEGRPCAVREVELWGLYVARRLHGTGVGQELLDTAIVPGTEAEVWVFRDNARARAFYARNGFEPDGAQFSDERFPELPEVRLVR
jgi:ribosomal protein S18 acetylase RimI-like enzyme